MAVVSDKQGVDLPGPYDLMWLSDAGCPLVEDVGVGIGCLKVKGHSEFSVPLCPAAVPLAKARDSIRSRWEPHVCSPVDPPIDADPALSLEQRAWRPDSIGSVFLRDGQRIEQCVSVFDYGASAQLTLTGDVALALDGASQGPCKLLALADGLHVVELSPELRPLEYQVRFDPIPERTEVDDVALAGDEVRMTSAPARWRFTWPNPAALTMTVSVIQDSVATRRWLAPSDVPAEHAARGASWKQFFREGVPRLVTPDARINRLCDYLHYVYRSNIMQLGGILPYPFSMPKQTFYGFWMWDVCYAVISARWTADRTSAWDNLLNVENLQYPQGDTAAGCVTNCSVNHGTQYFVSDDPMSRRGMSMPHRIPEEHGDGTHPPVFAQALEALWTVDGDEQMMRRLLPNALAYSDWFERRRASERVPGLLLARRWSDSGMDNSKRWGHQGSRIYGTELAASWWSMPVVTVDINVMSILELQAMARMCAAAGDGERAEALQEKARARSALVLETFWDAGEGYFFDLDEKTGRRIKVWSPTGMYPLLLEGISPRQIDSLVGHLFDETKFWTQAPMPSLAADDPDFKPSHSYWMGCTWLSYTVYTLRGLFRTRPQAAWTLLDRVLDMLFPQGSPSIFENYNPITGEGYDCANFSWHGMLIDVVISEMLGVTAGDDLATADCACPDHWAEWRIDNLSFKGNACTVTGVRVADGWIRSHSAAELSG